MNVRAHSRSILAGIMGLLWLAGCKPEPQPLNYGKDTCYSCKMTLADTKFGAELVTQTGKVYIFDDINCMMAFYNSGDIHHRDIAFTLVVDYEHPQHFLNAGEVFFVKSDAIRSPMASKVAAFETYDRAIQFKRANGGILLGWAEVTTQFK